MTGKLLTIVTTTFNCASVMPAYLEAFSALDTARFDWLVIDAGSTDGTVQLLEANAHLFSHYESTPDAGVYYGLNKALALLRTPYYLVFGADDRPSPTLLDDVLPLLSSGSPALVLGAVRLMPAGVIKRPGPRRWHPVVLGRALSHHAVGTVICADAHRRFGNYDVNYRVVADGAFLKAVLQSDEPVVRSPAIFGDYALGGISDRQHLRSIVETFLLQISAGSSLALQLVLLGLRLSKLSLKGGLRQAGCA